MRTAKLHEKKWRASLLLLVLFLASLALIVHLFTQRFGVGDIYPIYSSLRTDRLGVKIFSDSLERADYRVQRNYRLLRKMEVAPASTFLFIGQSAYIKDDLTELSRRGGRVILTMKPLDIKEKVEEKEEEVEEDDKPDEPVTEGNDEQPDEPENNRECESGEGEDKSFARVAGFSLDRFEQREKDEERRQRTAVGIIGETTVRIPWFSAAYFTEPDPEWRVMLAVDEQPVVMERAWGDGTLVVATDSHFLSNEALVHDRDANFLSWLMGENRSVIFDEAHHGVRRQVSITGLLRDFELHWVLIGLLAPAMLFIWRCASPLTPPLPEEAGNKESKAGRDQFSGLVNILRRHPPENLLQVCVGLWLKTNRHWRERHPSPAEEIQGIAREATVGKPVEKYKQIVALLRSHRPGKINNQTIETEMKIDHE